MRPFIIPAIMFNILVLFLSCDKDEGPDAFFINEIKFKKVQFMDLSKEGDGNIVRWEWDLGDGSTSTDKHPLHTYSKMDTSYSVRLSVTDENDLSDAITKEIAIPDTAMGPTIDYSYFQTGKLGVDSLEVIFTDLTDDGDGEITNWNWDFGDNSTSTEQNPVHIYTPDPSDTGYVLLHFFTVSLSVTDEFGFSHTLVKPSECNEKGENAESGCEELLDKEQCDTNEDCEWNDPNIIEVNNPDTLTTSFSFQIDTLTVSFTFTGYSDNEGEITQYTWDFGDGSTSTEQNPVHVYIIDGTYTVGLIITDQYCVSDTIENTITVDDDLLPPEAAFSSEIVNLVVYFTDESIAVSSAITSWAWDFGDGSTSTEQNPVYEFAASGTYSVSLTVTDGENNLSDIYSENLTVEAKPPTADFTHSGSNLIIGFTDESEAGSGMITSWNWEFGDGSTSTEQNPIHEYAIGDTFIVSLMVTNEHNLTDTYSDSIITVENLQIGPSASFAFSADSLTVTFVDLSSVGTDLEGNDVPIENWAWDFGDGNSSTEQNPEHPYSSEGIYNVNLSVTDASSLSDSHSEQVVLGIYFTASVNASGGGDEYDLTFGFSPLSTDGFDASHCLDSQGNPLPATDRITCLSGPNDNGEFGECPSCTIPPQTTLNGCDYNNCEWISIHTWVEGDAYAPPAPPPPAFDAALGWDNDRYYTQILAGLYSDVGGEHVYDIALGYPGDNLITIIWDNTGWSDLGTFVLQDAFGGVMINVDMTIETSLELTNPAFNLLKLKVTPAGSAGRSR